MAFRVCLLFIVALVVLQFFCSGNAVIVRRDTAEKNASQTIDEALQSFKSGIDDLVKNVQSNELFQNLSHTLKQFTDTVQQQGEELVRKFKDQNQTKVD